MDFATIIGAILAIAMVLVAILSGGDITVVINVPSMAIVVGGSAGVLMMKFSLGQFFGAIKIALKVLFHKQEPPTAVIDQVIDLANQARKGGVLALENVEITNKFLKRGVQYLVDGLPPEVVEETLTKEMTLAVERHLQGQQIFKSLGEIAPAMGMIGTLIGLVQMLSNMSDPSSIGPAMAVAMLTTLYGAMIANLMAFPIADKLKLRSKEERIIKQMMIDAIIGIQDGQNPRITQDILKTYLPDSQRDGAGEGGGEGGSESGGEEAAS